MLNVTVMKFPRAMDHLAVLFNLLLREWWTTLKETMRRHRHDVRRSVGKPDAGAGKRDLHHVLREVARGMKHVLVRGRDVATGSVVVSAEVSRDTTSFSGSQQQRQIDLALMVDN